MENRLENPMAQMLYHNALINLSNGCVSQVDRAILSDKPLPSSFIDPYVAQDVEAISAMDLAFISLTAWIEEAKKTNYFSQHFITLSKLIMDGVTTMARGLATLYAKGEALDRAPMNIQELISIGSYHIRKSHLGVLQTIKSHPEISKNLLLNQMKWTNTLLRLYKTKEKLEEKPDTRNSMNELNLKAGNTAALETGLPSDQAVPPSKETSFSKATALHEPGKYAPLRAYTPVCRQSKKQDRETISSQQQISEKTQTKTNDNITKRQETTKENAPSETKVHEINKSRETENKEPEKEITNLKLSEIETVEDRKTVPSIPEQTAPDQSPDFEPAANSETPYDSDPFIPLDLQILRNVTNRSLYQPPGTLLFKYKEIKLLLGDKAFLKDFPDIAWQLKQFITTKLQDTSAPFRDPFPDETLLQVEMTG